MSETVGTTRLWDAVHPYYCQEGNYFVGRRSEYEVHCEYESWDDFYEEYGKSDPDLNLVFRWDWKRPDPDDYEDGEEMPPEQLFVYWVSQRKAYLHSTACVITEADEPAVRAWLTERARTMAMVWSPIAVVEEA